MRRCLRICRYLFYIRLRGQLKWTLVSLKDGQRGADTRQSGATVLVLFPANEQETAQTHARYRKTSTFLSHNAIKYTLTFNFWTISQVIRCVSAEWTVCERQRTEGHKDESKHYQVTHSLSRAWKTQHLGYLTFKKERAKVRGFKPKHGAVEEWMKCSVRRQEESTYEAWEREKSQETTERKLPSFLRSTIYDHQLDCEKEIKNKKHLPFFFTFDT